MKTPNYVYDHLGNKFESYSAMCKKYNITYNDFNAKLVQGYDIEQILTNTIQPKWSYDICIDKTGKKFANEESMRIYHSHQKTKINNPYDAYKNKIKSQNLTTGLYTDHEGNSFSTIQDMCSYWNISRDAYNKRITHMTLEETLTKPITNVRQVGVEDENGIFYAYESLAKHTGCTINAIKNRLCKGQSVTTILENKKHRVRQSSKIDHKGNVFNTIQDLCDYWNANVITYVSRQRKGIDVKKSLCTSFPWRKINQHIIHISNEYTILKPIDKTYYLCSINNHELLQTFDQILDYALDIQQKSKNNISNEIIPKPMNFINDKYILCITEDGKEIIQHISTLQGGVLS